MSLNKLLKYRLKECETPKEEWPLKERIEDWFIETWWTFKQRSAIMRLWWKFAHRYIPKHQYHKIHIRDLEPNYYDPDTRIRHALFQELCDYLDVTDHTIEWSEKQEVYDTLNSVRQYWRVERKKLVELEEKALTAWHENRFGVGEVDDWIGKINAPRTDEDTRLFKVHTEAEQLIADMDKKYMHIIIDHMEQLWYP